ncbi:hypothetical protein [Nakamurella lactea]|jgi:hypothetical protein|uniref:hypothetical protein n=1 Tax=Nakamurella lactea TaxID=459515 RepID=UPI000406F53F|nr:hypothetical protein [Nakamurella lactea]
MTTALLVLLLIAVVLGGCGVALVLRHRTHLRRAAAAHKAAADRQLRLRRRAA